MLVPFSVDVPMQRWPIANWVLIALTSIVSLVILGGDEFEQWMVIGPGEDFTAAGLVGSLFTHLDVFHLAGNMLFLFVFGNAINAKIGNFFFPLCYLLLGVFEGIVWALLADGPAAGASGAIMGVLGMFIVFYPRNDVSIFYWFWARAGSFSLSAYFVIAAYFAFDVWGYFSQSGAEGGGGVAYLAHIAGFLGGFALASVLALTRLVESDSDEENLYEALGVLKD